MASEQDKKGADGLERIRTIATVLGAVLVPVVVAVVGQSYTAAIKQQESRTKFVELAIEILREAPPEGEQDPLRQWAADVVNANSGTKLSGQARTALVENRALPAGIRGEVDPQFQELVVRRSGGPVTVLALSDCPDRTDRVSMQILVGGVTQVDSHVPWGEAPALGFEPAEIVAPTALIDAILDASADCNLVLVVKQGGKTLRLEHVDLTAGENFFSMPLRIEEAR